MAVVSNSPSLSSHYFKYPANGKRKRKDVHFFFQSLDLDLEVAPMFSLEFH